MSGRGKGFPESRIRQGALALAMIIAVAGLGGCSQAQPLSEDSLRLRDRALDALKRGVKYEFLPSVRVQAVEAMQDVGGERMLPWIREALRDDHPAVRFAACMALGNRRDKVALAQIEPLLNSAVASDRMAAIFALHRAGRTGHTAALAGYLLEDSDPLNRRHAALILGRMGESGAIKLLARAMRDSDEGVRANALESMALLGAKEARSTLFANAYGGIGAEETLALNALGMLEDSQYRELFKTKLRNGTYLEVRLAAARALGRLGGKDGFDVSLRALSFNADKDLQNDPKENQEVRVRTMAALALGAIRDPRALPDLERMMNESEDPRLQLAAAKSILDIIGDRT